MIFMYFLKISIVNDCGFFFILTQYVIVNNLSRSTEPVFATHGLHFSHATLIGQHWSAMNKVNTITAAASSAATRCLLEYSERMRWNKRFERFNGMLQFCILLTIILTPVPSVDVVELPSQH